MKQKAGFSLLEMLIVLTVFSFLAIVATQSIFLVLRGARKSTSVAHVKQNVDYAISIMERQLHSASDVQPCPNPSSLLLEFTDRDGQDASFSCVNVGAEGYLASGSARLTSEEVAVTACEIICDQEGSSPPVITINVTAEEALSQGIEAGKVSTATKIYLRSY